MRIPSLIVIVLLFIPLAWSQNLVRNPDFESITFCPDSLGQFARAVKDWSRPNKGSTDYFNACSKTMGHSNFFGTQQPHSGQGYAGLYLVAPDDYREYVQASLNEPLKKGVTYTISFYLSLADQSPLAINTIGVLFLDGELKNHHSDSFIDPNKALNDNAKSHLSLVNSYSFYNIMAAWEQISFTYEAKGFETHFIIGNFDPNNQVATQHIQQSELPKGAYYFIDDVRVEQDSTLKRTSSPSTISKTSNITLNTIYKLDDVFFDFNKSALKPTSLEALDNLYHYLNANPKLHIALYGHTDNVGTIQQNDILSLERAKAVAMYLISKGLAPERVTATGYGTRFPLNANATSEDRAENRRVEFKLTKN